MNRNEVMRNPDLVNLFRQLNLPICKVTSESHGPLYDRLLGNLGRRDARIERRDAHQGAMDVTYKWNWGTDPDECNPLRSSCSGLHVKAAVSLAFSEAQIAIIASAIKLFIDNAFSACTTLKEFMAEGNYSLGYPLEAGTLLRTAYGESISQDQLISPNGENDPMLIHNGIWSSFCSWSDIIEPGSFRWFPSEYRTLIIHRYDEEIPEGSTSVEFGSGDINYYNAFGVLYIRLNGTVLGSTSPHPSGDDPSVWAGIIAHEILHNLNWKHGPNQDGSIIASYGDLVARQAGYSGPPSELSRIRG